MNKELKFVLNHRLIPSINNVLILGLIMNIYVKGLWSALLLSIMVASFLGVYNFIWKGDFDDSLPFSRFRDVMEIQRYIEMHRLDTYIKYYIGGEVFYETTNIRSSPSLQSNIDYSRTNVQVEGIDEPDYVKSDGRYIYVSVGDKLYIVRAFPIDDMEILSVIKLDNYTINGVYIYGDKLVVIASRNLIYRVDYFFIRLSFIPINYYQFTSILVFNVEDRNDPYLTENITMGGYIFESRLYNGILYVVSRQSPYNVVNENSEASLKYTLPIFYINNSLRSISPDKIFYIEDAKDLDFNYVNVLALDIENLEYNIISILMGYTSTLYMSYENIYLTQPYYDIISLEEGYSPGFSTIYTKIFRIKVDGLYILPISFGKVDGSIYSQLQLDEYKGFLRVSTYTMGYIGDRWLSYTNIYVLNMDLEVVSKVTGLAESEMLYSTRFMGEYAYLVTYRIIDPLFVVDLSDPLNPHVVGELKIPGFSTMLQPINESYLIGLGYEDNRNSLKISLFDVSNPENPIEIDKVILNGSIYSEALYNHRAITIVKDLNLVAFPILSDKLYIIQDNTSNGTKTIEYMNIPQIVLIHISNASLHLEGILDSIDSGGDLRPYFWFTRAVYIEGYIYVITGNGLTVYSYPKLEKISAINFISEENPQRVFIPM